MNSQSNDGAEPTVTGGKPRRVQLRQANKLPPNTLKVDRAGIFSNPFSVKQYGRERAVSMHREWLLGEMTEAHINAKWPMVIAGHLLHRRVAVLNGLQILSGKNLGCWCLEDGGPCHADVLIELANRG